MLFSYQGNNKKCQWFSGKIQRCHRWAPGSIPGWRSSLGLVAPKRGGLAQLVERMLSMHEVAGSIPASSIAFPITLVLSTACRALH